MFIQVEFHWRERERHTRVQNGATPLERERHTFSKRCNSVAERERQHFQKDAVPFERECKRERHMFKERGTLTSDDH